MSYQEYKISEVKLKQYINLLTDYLKKADGSEYNMFLLHDLLSCEYIPKESEIISYGSLVADIKHLSDFFMRHHLDNPYPKKHRELFIDLLGMTVFFHAKIVAYYQLKNEGHTAYQTYTLESMLTHMYQFMNGFGELQSVHGKLKKHLSHIIYNILEKILIEYYDNSQVA